MGRVFVGEEREDAVVVVDLGGCGGEVAGHFERVESRRCCPLPLVLGTGDDLRDGEVAILVAGAHDGLAWLA